jgi:thiol-disulfide isomerase/thioredoxin
VRRFVLAAALVGCARAPGPVAPGSVVSGPVAPGVPSGGTSSDWQRVTVVDSGGGSATLPALLRGHPALVSFWAPWCEPCVRELPSLDSIAKRANACGALVVGVAVGESPRTIAGFPPVRRLSYPNYADETFALADALGQRRVPATLVLDGAGRIVYTGAALDRRAIAALWAALGPVASGCDHGDL